MQQASLVRRMCLQLSLICRLRVQRLRKSQNDANLTLWDESHTLGALDMERKNFVFTSFNSNVSVNHGKCTWIIVGVSVLSFLIVWQCDARFTWAPTLILITIVCVM